MTKRKIMLITVCFAIFAISLLLSRQFFKSAGKRNMDVPAAGSEQIEQQHQKGQQNRKKWKMLP